MFNLKNMSNNSEVFTMKMKQNNTLHGIFRRKKVLIGMVHLLPLPGSPLFDHNKERILKHAIHDAEAIYDGGFDGIIIENLGDIPYFPSNVPPETIAYMTLIATKIRELVDIPIGINVLRNDAISALAIADATNAQFIRVNVLSGAYITDQGIITAVAHNLLRYRKQLNSQVKIFADFRVKHAEEIVERDFVIELNELAHRSLADVIIITGTRTGAMPALNDLKLAKESIEKPVFAGSGVNEENIENILKVVDGAIIGTSIKSTTNIFSPVDKRKVIRIAELAESLQ